MRLSRRFLVIPIVLVGVALFVLLVKTKTQPRRLSQAERTRAVRVIPAPLVEFVPRAVGYGNVMPAKVWQAVAEVQGRVASVHPDLDVGAVFPAGTELLRIDDTDYRLALTRAKADEATARARLREVEQKAQNTELQRAVEEDRLRLSEAELERKKSLLASGTISRSEYDREEQAWLSQQSRVQDYRNILALIPAERIRLEAQLETALSRLADARRDIEETVVTAPFGCRIAKVDVEKAQFVRAGQVMLVADFISQLEVAAQVPLSAFLRILGSAGEASGRLGTAQMEALRQALSPDATVRLSSQNKDVIWPARLSRLLDGVDPKTRTVGVVVTVDTTGAPLFKNMYCEVELRGQGQGEYIVLPRSAVREGRVYVANGEDRLAVREVEVRFRQGDIVVISSGISSGERVIVSDLVPAVEGMLLAPQQDDALLSNIVAEATGEGAP